MGSLCIIPARGGSKRILRKNLREFLGKPIICYSIEIALASRLFDEVMVSTDDEEIANLAMQSGASVPFLRSSGNAGDFATTADVLQEVLLRYLETGQVYSLACCLYPTAPFVTKERLSEGKALLEDRSCDCVFPIVKFEYPVWRALRKSDGKKVGMVWDEFRNSRSQDLEPVFHDAGQWYWFDTGAFSENLRLFTENSLGIELTPLEVQDIDDEHDWKLAEMKYAYLQGIK